MANIRFTSTGAGSTYYVSVRNALVGIVSKRDGVWYGRTMSGAQVSPVAITGKTRNAVAEELVRESRRSWT